MNIYIKENIYTENKADVKIVNNQNKMKNKRSYSESSAASKILKTRHCRSVCHWLVS